MLEFWEGCTASATSEGKRGGILANMAGMFSGLAEGTGLEHSILNVLSSIGGSGLALLPATTVSRSVAPPLAMKMSSPHSREGLRLTTPLDGPLLSMLPN